MIQSFSLSVDQIYHMNKDCEAFKQAQSWLARKIKERKEHEYRMMLMTYNAGTKH